MKWSFGLVMVLTSAAGIPAVAQTLSPSFDCTKADGAAEEAVCASDALAALDLETARLYELATASVEGEPLDMLQSFQRGWIKGRNECWKAEVALIDCVAASYATRIHELRASYPATQVESADAISTGPWQVTCGGLDTPVQAVFATTLVSLLWGENAVVLTRAETASGAIYDGVFYDGQPVTFWTKGQEALFMPPGGVEMACEIGSE
ncbi:MliC family protein [Litorisediminicola beolgyonensis]|uniref:MliC family protein n=1 Tax=Litorisediminicola beolgyonensis TaxID=1173614 RepID=A0ABW3ZDS2_9RHOB